MTLQEMLEELLRFYPMKNKTIENMQADLATYRELILGEAEKSEHQHDWTKCLKYIQLNRKFSTFPSIPDIIEALPHCIKPKEYKECTDEGSLIIITLPNGVKYDFVVSAIGRSLSSIKEEINNNYKGSKVEIYPKGTVRIGDTIFN